ncbi:DsbA family protein [Paenibacillus barcinonensis]|uniref:DsbA family protein n=1 Tax=Paenibacillus barcinonensis TaxID=198119 RepID=A0A2V4V862_PAEBA|nr:DsbA family protein [Paenibacillus barcinonensis]PYE48029.1 putative DsbA family dithiol-disulfide isomerase [Paenibacillus barcinonensis]QKS55146.1 DsbA family protein [Paenibacillus barcinonensis]
MSYESMMCDLETGVCGASDEEEMQMVDLKREEKSITMYYVTDPICSHCWALEPVLHRFIDEYGHYFHVETKMGGLLASWEGFSDGANGIQKPSDVAEHWREVGEHSRMPIDGSLWHDHPILSSYPPSRVYKVIQRMVPGKEQAFLRHAREAVFALNRNIGEDDVLIKLVDELGLNGKEIVEAASQQSAQDLLEEDFEAVAQLGVRGFPTIIIVNKEQKGIKVVGARALDTYVQALQQVLGDTPKPKKIKALSHKIQEGHLLFSKEIEVLYDVEQQDVESYVRSELQENTYQTKHIFNEMAIQRV